MTAEVYREAFAESEVETSQDQILVMLYDRLLRDIEAAVAALGTRPDLPAANAALSHAQDILVELLCALNYDVWNGAESVALLYDWALRELAAANVGKDGSRLGPVAAALVELRDSFAAAADSTATARRRAVADGASLRA